MSPGARYTFPFGINDAGQIVGFYGDSDGHIDGFLDTNGIFSTIDGPGSDVTASFGVTDLFGINDAGQIVGQVESPLSIDSSFLASPAPEPASLVLFGSAFAGFGLVRRRKRRAV